MRRYLAALVIGALLASLITGLLGSLGPSTGLPDLSRHLWAGYLALGGATGLSVLAVYGITAGCMWLCLLVATLCGRRSAPAPARGRAPQKEESWLPS